MRPVHVALAVLVAAIWGLNFVVIEVGLDDFPPLLLSALRYALASLPLLVRGGPRRAVAVGRRGRRWRSASSSSRCCSWAWTSACPRGWPRWCCRCRRSSRWASRPSLLGERLRGAQVAGLALASVGLALVASGLDGVATPAGFALVIAAAAAWGVGNVAIKRAAPADPFRFMSWMCLVPPVPLFVLSLSFEGPRAVGDALAGIDLGGIGAVAYIAFAATTRRLGPVGVPDARVLGLDGRAVLAARAGLRARASPRCCSASRSSIRVVVAAVLVVSGVFLTQRAPRISPHFAAIRARVPLRGESGAG